MGLDYVKLDADAEAAWMQVDSLDGDTALTLVSTYTGTGGTGGVYYPYGGALARVLTTKLKDTQVTAEVTGASVDNLT